MKEVPILDAAKILNVSMDTVRRRIGKGELKARKVPSPHGETYLVEVPDYTIAGEESNQYDEKTRLSEERYGFYGGVQPVHLKKPLDGNIRNRRSWVVTVNANDRVEALLSVLFRMKRVGRKVVLIAIGNHEEISTVGLTTYRINEDIGWEKMEAMSLGTHR